MGQISGGFLPASACGDSPTARVSHSHSLLLELAATAAGCQRWVPPTAATDRTAGPCLVLKAPIFKVPLHLQC